MKLDRNWASLRHAILAHSLTEAPSSQKKPKERKKKKREKSSPSSRRGECSSMAQETKGRLPKGEQSKDAADLRPTERERLERLSLEERIKGEQDIRRERLKAEEEIRMLRQHGEQLERQLLAKEKKKENAEQAPEGGRTREEASAAKNAEYLAVVRAVQSKLRGAAEQHKAERAAWEQQREELRNKQREALRLLALEREAREDLEKKQLAGIENHSLFHGLEREKLGQEKAVQDEALERSRLRIQELENRLAEESEARCKLEAEVNALQSTRRDMEQQVQLLRQELEPKSGPPVLEIQKWAEHNDISDLLATLLEAGFTNFPSLATLQDW